jgi:hypothetical protein
MVMRHREKTRGQRNARWIETYCLAPHGPDRGKRVRLTEREHHVVRQIYDGAGGPQDVPVTAPLSAYLALLHVCGPEGKQGDFRPDLRVDAFTLWNATSADLRAVLKRDGAHVICHGLGTRWLAA